jgi:ribonuclease Z
MTQVEITFLGTTASIPTKYRNHPAIYLRYQSENEHCFLFDCGEGTQKQMLLAGLNFMRLNHIFITHWHADHFAGLLGLIETMNLENRRKPLMIFAPEAQKFVKDLLDIGYAHKGFEIIAKDVEFEGSQTQKLLDEDEYEILAIPVKHGIPAVAYCFHEKDRIKIDKKKSKALGLPKRGPIYKKIKAGGSAVYKGKLINLKDISFVEKGKKVTYSGDTTPCDTLISLAKDSDILIHESTYFEDDLERKHTTFKDIIEIAEKTNAKRIILTHISRRYQNIKELREKIKDYPNMKIAKDFMKVNL